MADTSFVVFENEKQQESLGARTSALGVDRSFNPVRDYYVNFHDLNPNAPRSVFGAPLLATSGTVRPPERSEVAVPSGVTEYVGVRPGAEATVDLNYMDANPPIVRRFDGLHLTGTSDLVGPDQGRFEPFWRLAARGSEVLTVRRPGARKVWHLVADFAERRTGEGFLGYVSEQLTARGMPLGKELTVARLVVRANSLQAVPSAEGEVTSLLENRGLKQGCGTASEPTFCLRLPDEIISRRRSKNKRNWNRVDPFSLSYCLYWYRLEQQVYRCSSSLRVGVNSVSSRLSVSRAIKYCFTAQSASPQCLRLVQWSPGWS